MWDTGWDHITIGSGTELSVMDVTNRSTWGIPVIRVAFLRLWTSVQIVLRRPRVSAIISFV